jgi:hypothetical protein
MNSAIANWIRKHQLLSFFVLAYLITYGAGFAFVLLSPSQPLPPWSLAWFFQVFGPTFSALIITWIIGGKPGLKGLLSGLTRWKAGFFWYLAAAFLFLGPLAIGLIYKAMGNPSPGIQAGQTILSLSGIVLFTLFSGPIAEELGWRGFALPRLETKHNALVSSLILGVIWTCWHLPLFFTAGSSQRGIPFPVYLLLVTTVTIYITWLYNNTRGSLIITILAHFAYNMTGFLAGPLGLMPAMLFYITAGSLLALLVVAIIFIYGPRYLSKKPVAELPFQPEYGHGEGANLKAPAVP